MKTRLIGTSTWLLIFGAATVLLIGAFARFDSSSNPPANPRQASTPPPVAMLEPGDATEPAGGPTLPTDLSPGLAEIIKLAQARVSEDVLLAYVQNSGQTYNPSSDDILYLTDLGVSQKVIAALFPTKHPVPVEIAANAPPPPPSADFEAAPASPELPVRTVSTTAESGLASGVGVGRESLISPPVPADDPDPLLDPTTSYFYDDLAPYGSWVNLGARGWFWQPSVVATTVGWQPYRDSGRWRYTDSGWYWQSSYSWGWAAFHYGRWLNNPRFGWVWAPGPTWGPAWVAWRNTDEYAGWAPLPPGAPVPFNLPGSVGWSFALSPSSFTFVRFDNFTWPGLEEFAASASKAAAIFKASKPVNNYTMASKKILNLGVTAEQIAKATHRPVRQFELRDTSLIGANERAGGGALAVYRPAISDGAKRSATVNGDSRLSQANEADGADIPAREVAGTDDRRAMVIRPGTPPPAIPGWSTRRFSLSSDANRLSAPGRSDDGFAPPGAGEWSRAPGPREHDVIVSGAAPPQNYHGPDTWANRPSGYEEHSSSPAGEHQTMGNERGNSERTSSADAHAATSSGSSSKK